MSYQNPLTLTPKMYQSSDPDAPQLLGQLGDIKSIFKACLVTGYGSKVGAGYTIENETDRSCEFVSHNIMMSKIGLEEDNSTCKFYYYDGTVKKMPSWLSGQVSKTKVRSASWILLVCELGLYFIISTNSEISQVIYQGLIKSAINDNNKNMLQTAFGNFTDSAIQATGNVGSYQNFSLLSAAYTLSRYSKKEFLINLVSDVFWHDNGTLLGQQPALLFKNAFDLPRTTQITTYQNRPVLSVFLACGDGEYQLKRYGFVAMIYLDYWEY